VTDRQAGPDAGPPSAVPPSLVARAVALGAERRGLLGITGAPGAGKSTLAALLAAAVPGSVVVPMDGFHLPTARLQALGLVEVRGAPATFDADGYVALLRQLRDGGRVLAPSFDRSREEPVPAAIEVPADAPLVITEGNYLLLDEAPWSAVRSLVDEVWFVETPDDDRVQRLMARHIQFGRAPDDAWSRASAGSDADNARLVAATRERAELILTPDTIDASATDADRLSTP
jgi:pantothenate kinase